ncbi:transcriptional regulator [Xenococcus sp. PCC 7305]|uniref:TetR/AcrR family transcriptional regulator n=1 Tax=Xenococcus sp. PCC 7305 TaxID=102125 RepID=UPI0002ABD493|nr:TetR/AcrR family transcriptional regulator [Xenococcus sp. PCC 7305]ELS04651.1 transcriptional regulator [Xenococcus sp. PCC 7305]
MALTKEDWIDAGWSLMTSKGVEGVKVEVLARQLKVSKGSFYWHFKNRHELLEAILQRWEEQTMFLIQESQKTAHPKDRLVKLFSLISQICQEPDPEPAIFLWANRDPQVQKRVRELENKRVDYLSMLFKDYGFDAIAAKNRAEVAYMAMMGFADRQGRDSQFDLKMEDFNNFLLSLLTLSIKN